MRRTTWIATALLLPLSACGTKDEDTTKPIEESPVVIDDAQVQNPVTVHVDPAASSEATSADGLLTVTFPAGAVTEPVDITVGRLAREATPEGVVSDVYVLGPAMTFAEPVRLRLSFAVPGGVDPATLRLAHLDTGEAAFAVLDHWAYVPGDDTRPAAWAGDTTHLSAYGLVDGTAHTLSNDSPAAGGAAVGDELLAAHQIAAARDAYLAAVEARPGDLQAQFGAAITSLLLLPESAPVDDVLTLCGQPLFDIQGQLFGDSGFIAWLIKNRQGESTITIQRGAATGASETLELAPNTVSSEVRDADEHNPTRWIEVQLHDLRAGVNEEEIEVRLDLRDVEAATFVDGADLALGKPESPYIDLRLGSDDGNDCSDGSYCASTWTEPRSGTIHVVTAGNTVGAPIVLELEQVVIEQKQSQMMGPALTLATYTLNGRISDTLDREFEPASDKFPFVGLEDIAAVGTQPAQPVPVQIIEACGPTLTEPYLKGKLDELVAELAAVRGHLDAIAAASDSASFVWRLPVNAAANKLPIPVGIVEVQLLRALLFGADAANELAQQYEIVDPALALRDLFSTYTRYQESCGDVWVADTTGGGHYEWRCRVDTELVHDIDLAKLFAALDGHFLSATAVVDADSMAPVKGRIEDVLAALEGALLATPTADVLVNFQSAAAQPAAAELIGFLDMIRDSLAADVSPAATPEYTLNLHKFFSAPFTRASILAATGLSSLWRLQARDDVAQKNAQLEPNGDALAEAVKSFVTLPRSPDPTIYCAGDAECQTAGGESTWVCSGWDDQGGVCSHDRTTRCSGGSDCSQANAASVCLRNTCAPRDPAFFDKDVVDPAFDGNPPAFVNKALFDALREGL